jgi:ABC-type Fe3+ transport system permease subunit
MVATRGDTFSTMLPVVVAVMLTAGFALVFLQRAAMRRSAGRRIVEADVATPPRDAPPRPARPWWGNPWLWVAACALFAVLGFVVWPGLFGGTFVFLPFVWVWRPRREPKPDPRTNGHSRRGDTGSFTGS